MKTALTTALLFASVTSAWAGSTQPVRVVELFTSQGCSSCPPANEFVSKLAETDADTLALSYGVTYWDYLGWKDTFGDSRFTDRQRQYSDALGSNMYTPQMVINGSEDGPRFKTADVARHSLSQDIKMSETETDLTLDGDFPEGATLAVVSFSPGHQDVAVKRGENRGRKLTLANVVTGIDYHSWSGQPVSLPKPEEGLAVLVHDPKTSAIIAAMRYDAE